MFGFVLMGEAYATGDSSPRMSVTNPPALRRLYLFAPVSEPVLAVKPTRNWYARARRRTEQPLFTGTCDSLLADRHESTPRSTSTALVMLSSRLLDLCWL